MKKSFKEGNAFLRENVPGKMHLHVIVKVIPEEDKFICVFISSVKSGRGYDKSCELNVGDHEFINKLSYVVYDKVEFLTNLDYEFEMGRIKLKEDVSEEVLQRIKGGAKISEFLAPRYLKYFE